MIRVTFDLTKKPGTNLVEYPDDKSLFANVLIEGTKVYAEYFGAGALTTTDRVWSYVNPVIKARSFLRRFTSAERKLARESVDDTVIDLMEDLSAGSSVDLLDEETVAAVDYLIAAVPLDASRKWDILADGSDREKAV